MSGEKNTNKGVAKYVGRVRELGRKHCHHSNFYIGIHGYDWIESLQLFAEQTARNFVIKPAQIALLPTRPKSRNADRIYFCSLVVAPSGFCANYCNQ